MTNDLNETAILAEEAWLIIRDYIYKQNRKELANKFYDLFCKFGADHWDNGSLLEIDRGR